MSIEEYNEELSKIKQFCAYLTSILDTGYMNEIEDLQLLTAQLNNININSNGDTENNNIDYQDNAIDSDYDCIPFIISNKYSSFSDSPSSDTSSSDTSSSDTEEYSNESRNINKEQEKINRFTASILNNDIFQQCGNISLYKANGFDYIDTMKKFIIKSFIY